MIPHPSLATFVNATALAGLLCCSLPRAHAQSGLGTKLNVGIFSRAMMVQVFYRSDVWKAKAQAMVEEQNKAAAAGNLSLVDRIDRELKGMQALAQKQLSGDAPLKNIYDALKDEWPTIAKEAGVDVIVEPPVYLVPGATLVDVTPFIAKRLSTRGN